MNDEDLLIASGGKVRYTGGEVVWDFGFRSSTDQDREGGEFAPVDFKEDVPELKGDKVFLWDFAKAVSGKMPAWNWQVTGSCFPRGVEVRMADGSVKEIQDVKVGDRVVTHLSKDREVTHTFERDYTGVMYTIKSRGNGLPITSTADHPFAVYRDGTLTWVKAEDLKIGDDVIISGLLPEKSEYEALDFSDLFDTSEYAREDRRLKWIEERGVQDRVGHKQTKYKNRVFKTVQVNEDFGRFIGLYLAEGGCDVGRVTWTFNRNELSTLAADVIKYLKTIFGVESTISLQSSRPTVCAVRCTNRNVETILKTQAPGNVWSKRIPSCIMRAPRSVKLACLRGWIEGDGHIDRKGYYSVVGVSVCKALAKDFQTLALSLGITTSFQVRKAYKQSKQSYSVRMSGKVARDIFSEGHAVPVRDLQGLNTPYGRLSRIEKITTEDVAKLPVYDLTVDQDHSFVADNYLVHNCVNGGAQNTLLTLQGVEIATLPEAEAFEVPFTLPAYAQSRWDAFRDASEGEGSTGDAMAKALAQGNTVSIDHPLVPKPRFTGPAMTWTAAEELRWSSIRNIPDVVKTDGKKHPLKFGIVKSANELEKELRRGRPCTFAGNWGGLMRCPVEEGVLLNRRASTWQHQQSVLGLWLHPKLGRLFFVLNQWYYEPNGPGSAVSVHGPVTNGEPAGGYWIREADADYQCRTGEVRSFYSLSGFPGLIDFGAV
jgi:intein/homing endonuclease